MPTDHTPADRGICGAIYLGVGIIRGGVCELLHGHAGWHRHGGMSWTEEPGEQPRAFTQADVDAAYARGIAEGRRQATEGWEREWLVDHPPYGGADLFVTEGLAREEAARLGRPIFVRLVGPWETAEQPEACASRIAHESGVVLACTVDHGEPRSGLHANVHHRVMWDDEDDRVVARAAEQSEGNDRDG